MSLRIADIKSVVIRHFKLQPGELEGPSRLRDKVVPRHIAFEMSRRYTNRSLPRIAREFGGRDHTTIISGQRELKKKLARDPELRDQFETIDIELRQLAAANSEETPVG